MAPLRLRERIRAPDLIDVVGLDPTAGILSISGVRIHDVGQGDSVSVLDETGFPFLQIDYGGRVGSPFQNASQTDGQMPVHIDRLVMLSHWDEDHWCSAAKGNLAQAADWLVPRQLTSPRAVRFSLTLAKVHCVPETLVGQHFCFTTVSGDQVWWEKIAPAPARTAKEEDCNHTGIAFSIVKRGPGSTESVILCPGDAPYGEVGHYWDHSAAGRILRGMIAFHHGTNRNWTRRTRSLLGTWKNFVAPVDVVFSCALNNSYGHPHKANYSAMPFRTRMITTPALRRGSRGHHDLLF